MEPNSRMDEIKSNLKRDMKDLLSESANIVTGFFKRGFCTVRAAADKWKSFTNSISDAVNTLVKTPLIPPDQEAFSYDLYPDSEPIVTVVESENRDIPIGKQMTLSEANVYVSQMDKARHDANEAPYPVKVKIDYMWDVTSDRYWLPLEIGSGRGGLLDQMEKYLTPYRSNPERIMQDLNMQKADTKFQEDFHASFLPFLQESVNDLLDNLLPYFRNHCQITELKKAAEAVIPGMGEGRQGEYKKMVDNKIGYLRQLVNCREVTQLPQQLRSSKEMSRQTAQETSPQSRQPVKTRLEQLKAKQAAQPDRAKHIPSRPKLK